MFYHNYPILLFDDVVKLFSVTDALIMLKIPSKPIKLQEIKTGAREDAKLFERGIVKNNSLGKYFVYSGTVKIDYLSSELHKVNIFKEVFELVLFDNLKECKTCRKKNLNSQVIYSKRLKFESLNILLFEHFRKTMMLKKTLFLKDFTNR